MNKVPPFSCGSGSCPFCDEGLPVRERARDLISRLTLHEKLTQLINKAPAISRLGVPYYQRWLWGVAVAEPWGRQERYQLPSGHTHRLLIRRPSLVSDCKGIRVGGGGLETPCSLKDDHLLVSACCKHFTAYDLESWKGYERFTFNANVIVTKQDMADTYRPPFKGCIKEGKASGLMCAYNLVNGVPNCVDYDLLTKTARGEWGFDGYITSDCDAVLLHFDKQHYAKSDEEAVADALKAGLDVSCGTYLRNHIKSAILKGIVSESDIDIDIDIDNVVLVKGLNQKHETEYKDREDLVLPGEQESLIMSVAKVAKKPVVLVLLCGGPVDVSFAKNEPKIGSILWAGYPGQAGGRAIAEIIFGDYNPGGRLTMTWYPQEFVKIPMIDMRMRADTYRLYRGKKTVKTDVKEKVLVKFSVNPCEHFSSANEDGEMVIESGDASLVVGDEEEHPIRINM
ncbi:hypothetical protein SASPL_103113 [Salvia splendens]|uniref:Beta-D-xylosidase 4 n=1 Tax=Salvia splendens TaxID=180675 RepID=A0A8X9AE81_SALSN|nr:hypothetical protein SASPL_103113 [Salvia splendens]